MPCFITEPIGFVYLRARYYDPLTGRFITKDPFPGLDALSQTQNPYVYGLNNPVLYTDPSGEFGETPWDLLMVGFDLVMLGIDTYHINFGDACDREAWELQRNLDYAALGMDATALFVPFLPRGTGAAGSAAVRLGLKVPAGARAVQAVAKGAQIGGQGYLMANNGDSILSRLPERKGGKGKTTGILVVNGKELPSITSGRSGYASNIPKGTRGFNMVTKTHVEGHAAAYMRQNNIKHAELYINNPPCGGIRGCDAMLKRMLPEGSSLTVIGPNGFRKTYMGIAD